MTRETRLTAAAGLLGVVVFVALAATAAAQVSIWLDEVLQMEGLRHSPLEVVTFLRAPAALGGLLPAEIVPPLSYWIGWFWAQVFGLDAAAMRWFGIFCGAVACLLVAGIGARVGGRRGAFIAALLFATSPNVVMYAINIRYYPLFLVWSACSFFCFVGWADRPRHPSRWIAAFTASLVLAIHTHAYGLVLAGSLWVAVLVTQRLRPSRDTWIGMAVTFAATLAVMPFVLAALDHKANVVAMDAHWYQIGRLLYRSLGHAATATSVAATSALFLGAALAVTVLYFGARHPRRSGRAILGALMLGMVVTSMAVLLRPSLSAQEPRYSLWMLPGIAAILAAAATVRWPRSLPLGGFAVLLVLAANVYGSSVLVRHAPLFWLSNYEQLRPLLGCESAAVDAVIHEQDRSVPFMQAPILHDRGRSLAQYVHSPQQPGGMVQRMPRGSGSIAVDQLKANCIAVIRSQLIHWRDVRSVLAGTPPLLPRAALAAELETSGQWRSESDTTIWSSVAARVTVFARVPGR